MWEVDAVERFAQGLFNPKNINKPVADILYLLSGKNRDMIRRSIWAVAFDKNGKPLAKATDFEKVTCHEYINRFKDKNEQGLQTFFGIGPKAAILLLTIFSYAPSD